MLGRLYELDDVGGRIQRALHYRRHRFAIISMAVLPLILDALGWRAVAAMFDRERLVTGGRT